MRLCGTVVKEEGGWKSLKIEGLGEGNVRKTA
jgi:hypothetical protein